jgi:hypothetical protein
MDEGYLLSPVGRKLAHFLIVASEPMHAGFDQDKTELRILVLPVALQMLTDRHGLLDKAVQVLRDFRGKACRSGIYVLLSLVLHTNKDMRADKSRLSEWKFESDEC